MNRKNLKNILKIILYKKKKRLKGVGVADD
jgi:hypothetical protein